jgi:hypothetical protein
VAIMPPQKELACRVCTIDFKAQVRGGAVWLGQGDVVEHCADVQQLYIRPQTTAEARQSAE